MNGTVYPNISANSWRHRQPMLLILTLLLLFGDLCLGHIDESPFVSLSLFLSRSVCAREKQGVEKLFVIRLCLAPYLIFQEYFVLACENLWCNRIYALCHFAILCCRKSALTSHAHLSETLFAQSSSLFEHCVSGKLDYLQGKRKHMLT